jgi:protein TonB
MKSASHRRLAGALAISILLHLLAIIPLRLPIDSPADTLQIYLQATVSRKPPVATPPEKASPPPNKQAPSAPAGTLTAADGARHTAAPATPPAMEQSTAEPADALVLDQALLPEYPAAALAQGLEGCVLASVLVGIGGEVESVSILAADHPGVFDASVIEAQKSARYAPGRQGSEAIPSRVLAIAAFVIQPGKQLGCPLKYAEQAEKLVRGKAP